MTTMRLFEFADAEAQVALWKLISDSVWAAIETERAEQARAAAQKAATKPKRTARPKTVRHVSVTLPASPKPKAQPKKTAAKSKEKAASPTTAQPQKQQSQPKPSANNARSNAAPLNPPSSSSASLAAQDAATAQSVAQTQKELYPLANDETVKKLVR